MAFLTALMGVRQGMRGNLTLDPFNPSAATGGLHRIFPALLGLLAISGFDVISPIAEETRAPRRLIPLATILITVNPGMF